ncbi:response regulator [Coralloluteibacterium stylophorae]|uniref:Response regulator transcription factor n=1 Tax=Coralloluteibacterium stylophorae TaxID=1776034 RepID=A0A8J7VRF4_9GAMM|nr:response regulator transcription factor [Coralloluteibacterium stylophorae]MBS7458445.1 response regulator transcription factor [Coralloluteibacterium stylophorae]
MDGGVGGIRSPAFRPLRIALADDHAVVRKGYRRLLELEDDMQVVAEFGDGDGVYAWLRDNPVDVLVLDLSMPGRSGLDVLQRLMQRGDAVRVLVFTMHESAALAGQALALGACGYLTKSSAPEALTDAVREVARGRRVVAAGLDRDPATGQAPHRQLSPREFEVFLLLAEGDAVERIARTLRLSEKTVANYQTTIRQKTGLGSALEMYRYALAHGLVEAPLLRA